MGHRVCATAGWTPRASRRRREGACARGSAPRRLPRLAVISDDLCAADGPDYPDCGALPVHTQVKADASCAVVAAASVLAKVARDRLMREAEDPGYGWASNKGYGSAAHARAIARLGVSDFHRRTWRMPQVRTNEGTPGWRGA